MDITTILNTIWQNPETPLWFAVTGMAFAAFVLFLRYLFEATKSNQTNNAALHESNKRLLETLMTVASKYEAVASSVEAVQKNAAQTEMRILTEVKIGQKQTDDLRQQFTQYSESQTNILADLTRHVTEMKASIGTLTKTLETQTEQNQATVGMVRRFESMVMQSLQRLEATIAALQRALDAHTQMEADEKPDGKSNEKPNEQADES